MSSIINATTTAGVTVTGDNSGSLQLATNNGTTAVTIDTNQRAAFVAGTAALPAITTTGDTNTGIFFPAADTIAFTEGGVESMRIDSSGNVGIGTSSPAFLTEIVGGATTVETTLLQIRSNAGGINTGTTIALANSTNTTAGSGRVELAALRDTASGSSFVIRTADSGGSIGEKVRIDSDGNVGIGTASPSQKLHVDGGSGMSSSALIARFFGTSGNSMLIRGSGNVENTNGSYGAISDQKLKENIVDATSKLDKVNQLKVRNYNLIGDELKQIGFVAQEIEQVFPSIVSEISDLDEEGNDLGTTTKTVKTSVLIPILVKAMQEQQAMIQELKAELDATKAEVQALKGTL